MFSEVLLYTGGSLCCPLNFSALFHARRAACTQASTTPVVGCSFSRGTVVVSAHVIPEGKKDFFVPSAMGLHHLLECDGGLALLELLLQLSKPG